MNSSMHLFQRGDPLLIAAPSSEPFTSPALTANLFFRVCLGIVANLVCLVPLRNLYKHGELAGAVFIANLEVQNLQTILYSLIWRNNDVGSWWPGYGLCDVHPYIYNFITSLYLASLLAIVRNLAQQVGLLRANSLSVREKRRRNLVQALVMFPLPIMQVAWSWPLTAQRYVVGALMGCIWIGHTSWPYLVLYVIAPWIVTVLAAIYAGKFSPITKFQRALD